MSVEVYGCRSPSAGGIIVISLQLPRPLLKDFIARRWSSRLLLSGFGARATPLQHHRHDAISHFGLSALLCFEIFNQRRTDYGNIHLNIQHTKPSTPVLNQCGWASTARRLYFCTVMSPVISTTRGALPIWRTLYQHRRRLSCTRLSLIFVVAIFFFQWQALRCW